MSSPAFTALTNPNLSNTAMNDEALINSKKSLRFADVGINLGDPVFQGIYHGKKAHDDDLDDVLQRAVDVGCVKMMVTGSDLTESRKAVKMAEKYRQSVSLYRKFCSVPASSYFGLFLCFLMNLFLSFYKIIAILEFY